MFATVVVVCPAGSSVSASMPTAMRSCLGTACAPAGALRRENTTATNATIAPRRAQILSTPTPPSQELADFQMCGFTEHYGMRCCFPLRTPTFSGATYRELCGCTAAHSSNHGRRVCPVPQGYLLESRPRKALSEITNLR